MVRVDKRRLRDVDASPLRRSLALTRNANRRDDRIAEILTIRKRLSSSLRSRPTQPLTLGSLPRKRMALVEFGRKGGLPNQDAGCVLTALLRHIPTPLS